MTDEALSAALAALVVVVRQTDLGWLVYAMNTFGLGLIRAAADAFDEVVSGAWLGEEDYLPQLLPVQAALQARMPRSHPVDFEPPYRYGHLQG